MKKHPAPRIGKAALGTESEAAELRRLLDVFYTTHAETLRQLDRTDRKLDAALAGSPRRGNPAITGRRD